MFIFVLYHQFYSPPCRPQSQQIIIQARRSWLSLAQNVGESLVISIDAIKREYNFDKIVLRAPVLYRVLCSADTRLRQKTSRTNFHNATWNIPCQAMLIKWIASLYKAFLRVFLLPLSIVIYRGSIDIKWKHGVSSWQGITFSHFSK